MDINDDAINAILAHLETDNFTKQDYNDCLTPGYTVPGLLMRMVRAGGAANQLS